MMVYAEVMRRVSIRFLRGLTDARLKKKSRKKERKQNLPNRKIANDPALRERREGSGDETRGGEGGLQRIRTEHSVCIPPSLYRFLRFSATYYGQIAEKGEIVEIGNLCGPLFAR